MKAERFPTTPDCEIRSERIFRFSRELVFKAWSDPDHLKNWWGPQGFTNIFHTFDFRPGGRWSFIMHGPEKGNYNNECEFLVIESNSLIAWQRISKPLFKVVAKFEGLSPDTTRLVFRQIFDNEVECNKVKKFAVDKNEENFDRLEEELKKMHDANERI